MVLIKFDLEIARDLDIAHYLGIDLFAYLLDFLLGGSYLTADKKLALNIYDACIFISLDIIGRYILKIILADIRQSLFTMSCI